MPYCTKCGSEVEEEDRFCRNCGAELKPVKLKEKKAKKIESKPRKEKPEESLSQEELKARIELKKELEEAIRAFKAGEISIEEFQRKKKEIAEKLKMVKLGLKAVEIEKKEEAEISEIEPQPKIEPRITKTRDVAKKAGIAIGIILILSAIAFGIYSYKDRILPTQRAKEKGIKILSPGDKINETVEKTQVKALEKINLKPQDFGDDARYFFIEEKYTGYIKDALEFAAGDEKLAEKLLARGWEENHRIVMKKVIDNETIMEIDSSLSRYNLSRAENFTLKDLLDEKINELEAQGYNISGASMDDTSIIAKKVDKPKGSDDVFVFYVLAFYKNDIFAELKVSGLVRKVRGEDVINYGNIIAGRI